MMAYLNLELTYEVLYVRPGVYMTHEIVKEGFAGHPIGVEGNHYLEGCQSSHPMITMTFR